MSHIDYQYTVLSVNEAARCMELVYASEGRMSMHIGARLPFEGETLQSVAEMYAPVAYWREQEAAVLVPAVGATGASVRPLPPTLESAKSAKRAEVAVWRFEQETSGVVVRGHVIRTDRESQSLVAATFMALQSGLMEAVDWKRADGDFVKFTPPQFSEVATAVVQHVQAAFSKERELLDEVAVAASLEAVNAITIPAVLRPGKIPATVL